MYAEFLPNEEKDIFTLMNDILDLGYDARISKESVTVEVSGTSGFYALAEELYGEVTKNEVDIEQELDIQYVTE